MTEPRSWHPRLTRWVDRVDEQWRRQGIPDHVRLIWRRDLVVDLGQARLGGAAIDDLIGTEPQRFARDVAEAHGLEGTRTTATTYPTWLPKADRSGFVIVALVGALLGALLSVVTVYPAGYAILERLLALSYHQQGVVALVIHDAASVMAAASGGSAVHWHFRNSDQARRLAVEAFVGLLVGGALATPLAMGVAWLSAYSSQPDIVALEVAVVAACCAAALLAIARLLTIPASPPKPQGSGSPLEI